jgi:hypothetical protein
MKYREKALKRQNFLFFASGLGFLVELNENRVAVEKFEEKKKAKIGNVAATDFFFFCFVQVCKAARVSV